MPIFLKPDEVRYRLCRLFGREKHDEAAWPTIAGFTANVIAEQYARDFLRCEEISRMIMEDEAAQPEEPADG